MFRKKIALHLGWITFFLLLAQPSLGTDRLFQVAQSYNSGGWNAFSIAVEDVNGDGKPDVLVTNFCVDPYTCPDTGLVAVLLGNGDGTFQVARTYDSGGEGAESIAVADVNGDGKLDIVVANRCVDQNHCGDGESNLGVLLGNGDGTFQAAKIYKSGGLHESFLALFVAATDVNGDGKPDLLVANSCVTDNCDGAVGVLLGNGDGTFQTVESYSSGGLYASSVAAADVNSDGKTDLLVTNSSTADPSDGSVGVLLGNGDGTFHTAITYNTGGSVARSIAVEDVNGDGKPDLLVANAYISNTDVVHGSAGVLLGNGDGTFKPAQTYQSSGFVVSSITVGDVNGDGKSDLLLANEWLNGRDHRGIVDVLLGNGDGSFHAVPGYRSGGWGPQSLVVRDVNADGKPDVLVAQNWLNCRTGDCTMSVVGVLLGTARFVTATSLNSNPNPSVYGQAVTLTATVTSVGRNTPTGTVTFWNGTLRLGHAILQGGIATITKKILPVGTLSITAKYIGDAQSAKSTSAPLVQVVKAAASVATIK